jgi:3-hydroxyacyl-CoA dehydrogenase
MFWADQEGLDTILSAVKKYHSTVGGEQWEPSALLEKLVADGRKFADL